MPLTEKDVKALQPKDKQYRVCDYDCLYILVYKSGKRSWLYRSRGKGGAREIVIGEWPEMSLKEARAKREEIRAQGSTFVPQSMTFRDVALEWLKRKVLPSQVRSHVARQISRLEHHIYPTLGSVPVAEITVPKVLETLNPIQDAGHYATAHKVLNIISQVLRYGVLLKQCKYDVTAELRGALTPIPDRHFASITDPEKIAGLMRSISAEGSPIVRRALLFQAYTFVRPGELRQAEWAEINFERAEWRLPAEKMKMRRPHVVPLSRQALQILKEMRSISGEGKSPWVFPALRTPSRPMSENTILAALRRLGYSQEEMTGHGFRSMASTNLNEMGWSADVIERQLAHADDNGVRAAYNYAEYLPERRKMMQAWADWLDALRDGLPEPEKPLL